ncbi:hypothetical protein R3I93_003818 [Phoxinus phoxinus]|uniref:SAM domain-containing protein n=1 Tax=Phoxinus phoxinus TaxID=58324 RepID=A0AAN9DE05_9TELE
MSSVPLEGSQLVSEWLNHLRLDQYISAFQESGLETLWECQDLSSAKLQRIGVALPGHRKRILGSLRKLFPSEAGMEDDDERDDERPVARERTKFATENKRLPPVPPRLMPNRPPVPFTPGSVTMETPAEQATPIPTPRPRPQHLPLKGPAQQLQKSESKHSPQSPTSSSSSSSSSSSEHFHLYEQCSSSSPGEAGAPPLPPKSYAVGVPKDEPAPVPYRPPVPPPRVSVCSRTSNPRSSSTGCPPAFRYNTLCLL